MGLFDKKNQEPLITNFKPVHFEKPRILYLCSRKKCEVCNKDCTHTDDISFAANFKMQRTTPRVFLESEKIPGEKNSENNSNE